jgi:hypothetical protein
MGGSVGGETVRSVWPRVQFGRTRELACLGRYDRPGSKVGVAWHRGLGALHGHV